MQRASTVDLGDYVDLAWPPMRHVRRGAERLGPDGMRLVLERLDATLRTFRLRDGVNRAALRRFFSFLSQVEVIAIEVPLSALPTARPEVRPLLERQLADEVFHAAVFAALALRLGGLDKPLPEAERLLDQIRNQTDPRTTAVLLNLVAEGWIENLFDHAVTWGVADEVFAIVLEDESRHVEEAMAHAEGLDSRAVEAAVRSFEEDLFRLVQHPRVLLPTLKLAGDEKFRTLGESFLHTHVSALRQVGLEPADGVRQLADALAGVEAPRSRATRVAPETQWRRTALELWDVPRNPVMHGWFDACVDHVPKRLLTAVLVCAVGKVWAEYPRMNRYAYAGEAWQPSGVNVGVRVAVGEKGEALSTVVITDADRRSPRDVARILEAGVRRLNEAGKGLEGVQVDPEAEPLAQVLRDEELMGMVPPETVAAPVTVSNVGRAGLVAGFGAMPGALGQSVEVILGRVEKKPQWRRWRYKPADTVTVGCSADHRVIDGPHAAVAMEKLREALSPAGVRAILARPDTLSSDPVKAEAQALASAGLTHEQAALVFSCKAPWWLGWLCWLFKK